MQIIENSTTKKPACIECRKRHTSCSRGNPCQRCEKYGIECTYPKDPKKRGRPRTWPIFRNHLNQFMAPPNLKPKDERSKEKEVEKKAVRKRERMPQISELLNEESHSNGMLGNLRNFFTSRRDSM